MTLKISRKNTLTTEYLKTKTIGWLVISEREGGGVGGVDLLQKTLFVLFYYLELSLSITNASPTHCF